MCDGLKYVMKSSVTPPRILSIKALLKQINASARLFRGGWYYVTQDKSTRTKMIYFRVYLIPITSACSCLRRSPDLMCCVANALRAFATQHIKSVRGEAARAPDERK